MTFNLGGARRSSARSFSPAWRSSSVRAPARRPRAPARRPSGSAGRRPQPRHRHAARAGRGRRSPSPSASSWPTRTRPPRTRTLKRSTTRRARATAATSTRTAFNQQFGVPAATTPQRRSPGSRAPGSRSTTVEGATNYLLATGTAAQVRAGVLDDAEPLLDERRHLLREHGRAGRPRRPRRRHGARAQQPAPLPDRDEDRRPTRAPTGAAVPNTGLLSPKNLWSIYDQPSTNLGNGQTMGILGWGVTDGVVADLRSFENEWKLPQVPVTVKRYGDTSTPDTSGDGATGEWELDTQASTGMAPNVTSETLYFAHHNTDADILASLAGWVNDRTGPLQASASYGECENVGNGGAVLTDGMRGPGRQAARAGRRRGPHALLLDRRHRLLVPAAREHERRSRRRCTPASSGRRSARMRSPSAAPT